MKWASGYCFLCVKGDSCKLQNYRMINVFNFALLASPCSLYSVFSHHLLCGAAATSQHVRHVSLRAAGHPCVWGQWWVTFRYTTFLQGWLWPLQDETSATYPRCFTLYIMIIPGIIRGHCADLHSACPCCCQFECSHCWHPPCSLCSLYKPSVSTVQHPAQHRHCRSALRLLLRSSEGERKQCLITTKHKVQATLKEERILDL